MPKYLCIHGHFYQPPRENPWTDTIELQPSAHPFHDWNQRITSECYTPNAHCEVIGDHNEVLAVLNNYAYMSFNFGPTLLSWLENNAEETYRKILEADKISQEHFNGHGSAMAQCYNHMIMPLANEKDRQTQVIWGVEDFKYRYGRAPEGMWLPETAVDLKSLDILAEHGILFTILAPKQAAEVRRGGSEQWEEVTEKKLNVQTPYWCHLPSGRKIVVFFYDGAVSGNIAFGKIIRSAHEMKSVISKKWKPDLENPLFSIAVDGETFGHHRRFGDMALAYLLYMAQKGSWTELTNYAAYLAKFPPEYEVRIHENTAWSSWDGLKRWMSDGGGYIHPHKGWTQAWRAPLREAMDFLRDSMEPHYVRAMEDEGRDPWEERNKYISHLLQKKEPDPLLEMQKFAMFMYTSCGWFFDDISGLEVRQILQYAARALEICREHLGVDLEEDFLNILARAQSNIPEMKDGRHVYEQYVLPLRK